MGYPTATTIWPSSNCSAEVRGLIDRFFLLADTKEDDVGARIAKNLFTPDGTIFTPSGIFKGAGRASTIFLSSYISVISMLIFAAEISESRKNAWASVKSRRHVVLKVYRNDAHHEDVFIVGLLTLESLEGTKSNHEFVARMEIERTSSEPRIKQYQVVSPAPLKSRPLFAPES
jgi:hypothetical protein